MSTVARPAPWPLLRLQLWLRRQAPSGLLAALLCALGLLMGLQLAWVQQQRQREAAAAAHAVQAQRRQAAAAHATALPAPEAERFHAMLGDPAQASQLLRPLFSLAERSGVVIERGDYQLIDEEAGGYLVYRANLPISGTYPSVRRFCEQVLRTMPFVSIDQLTLRREHGGEALLKVRLSLSLYLAGRAGARP